MFGICCEFWRPLKLLVADLKKIIRLGLILFVQDFTLTSFRVDSVRVYLALGGCSELDCLFEVNSFGKLKKELQNVAQVAQR